MNTGFKRFCLKGNEKVDVEFGLVALAHNLRKYGKAAFRHGTFPNYAYLYR